MGSETPALTDEVTTKQTFEVLPIGTTIFVPRVDHKQIEVPCPDCADTKYWHVYANKQKFMIDCPRCNGGRDDWMKPKRYEHQTSISQVVIKSIQISSHLKHNSETEILTYVSYETTPYAGQFKHEHAFTTREAAEAEAKILLEKAEAQEKSRWDEDRERDAKRAGMGIIRALEAKSSRNVKSLEDKIDKLKSAMLDAIRNGDGPELRRPYSGAAPEMTSSAIADFLANLLSEANIDGFTEDELHEAMCHC